jgi:Trk K+ transport system NAD-binding subunit
MDQPFILCGVGRLGWRVLEYLQAAGLPVVVVDINLKPDDRRLARVTCITGDCRSREVLEAAGVARSQGVLILTSDDLVNISAALMVRDLNPDVRVVLRMFNQNLIARLGNAVHNVYALSQSALTAPVLALMALTGQSLGTFRIYGMADGRRQVAEVSIGGGSPLHGQSIGWTAAGYHAQILAYYAAGEKEGRFLLDVDPEARLRAGDRLIICAEPSDVAGLQARVTDEVPPHVLWASWLRRNGRVFWQTLGEVDLAVKVCTGVLIFVLVVSTLIFHFNVPKDDRYLPNALYRTVSAMATGAEMHGEDLAEQGWLKVYVSLLRIAGAALLAAFTAIVTNFLLRARLSGALEVRRIPDSGHVVVCGLGDIGYRVVEELIGCEERVVAIELSRDSRFETTARRKGAAIINGDARVREVLRQAHADTARAVLAVTSNDLVNLEIALLARELNPRQRVVVLMTDPSLAQTLRDAANVRLALSVPALAAPAFLAALFGDRVLSTFLVNGRLLGVADLVVQPQDSVLSGQLLRGVALDYRFLPVAVLSADGDLQPEPMRVRLRPGDRLVAVVALPDLERLLRREPTPADTVLQVLAVPLTARSAVVQRFQEVQGLSAEAAEQALEQLPACLSRNLTRGQAQAMLCQLREDGATAHVCKAEDAAPAEAGQPLSTR